MLARSFERIHFANLVNYGIVPLVLTSNADYEALQPGDVLEMSGLLDSVRQAESIVVSNKTRGVTFVGKLNLSDRQRDILLAGGVLRYARATAKTSVQSV